MNKSSGAVTVRKKHLFIDDVDTLFMAWVHPT